MRRITRSLISSIVCITLTVILLCLPFLEDITFSETIHSGFASLANNLNLDPTYAFAKERPSVIGQNVSSGNNKIVSLSTKSQSKNTLPLIIDSTKIDYMSYITRFTISSKVKAAINVKNPDITINASSAILLDVKNGKVLYSKAATSPIFPASTAKLLSALVLMDWYKTSDIITVGDEVELITKDASVAHLKKGEVLTVSTLLSAMLLPSGNDAAYVTAVHVGRKSLKNSKASNMTAIKEFVRLMNAKAKKLGAENSNFVTPDGYDAKGQYTTAYDMGRIALAAVKNNTILSVTKRSSMTVTLISGQTLTWKNTNSLINKSSEWYAPHAIGLKTGTTTMAGKCLISAAKNDKGMVISVIMHSSTTGRWNDSINLLTYGLKKL